ncbi:MAG: tRNA (adenosine(37)-N6)-dimethylallyltransferase MiaA [Candidatus Ancillula sp.]|jgi:tRNA dimethylallyltransferase|nr:tRNA (adenosine(37)-N6)-dimethylallyltransferase MiaA [Candidatus Ancillula sp.]
MDFQNLGEHDYLEQALQLVLESSVDILAIVGPTATGKSQLAINLALKLKEQGVNADIVNADAYSRYKLLDIAVAKVPLAFRRELAEKYNIKHYQVDVVDPQRITNVAEYKKSAIQDIDTIRATGHLPIVCGGSGLYLRSILDNFEFQATNATVRNALEEELETTGVAKLYERLKEKDPQTAITLDAQNERRIIRALEVLELSGENYQRKLPEYTYAVERTLQLFVDYPTSVLDTRVEERLDKMRSLNLLNEVLELEPLLGPTASKAIGYPEMLAYIHGDAYPATGKKMSLDNAYTMIGTHTKRLIRRQRSWFLRDPRLVFLGAQDKKQQL